MMNVYNFFSFKYFTIAKITKQILQKNNDRKISKIADK